MTSIYRYIYDIEAILTQKIQAWISEKLAFLFYTVNSSFYTLWCLNCSFSSCNYKKLNIWHLSVKFVCSDETKLAVVKKNKVIVDTYDTKSMLRMICQVPRR